MTMWHEARRRPLGFWRTLAIVALCLFLVLALFSMGVSIYLGLREVLSTITPAP